VKRIAWESRPVEHRTVPAGDRMAGHAPLPPAATGASQLAGTSAPSPPACAGGASQPASSQIASEIANRVFAAVGTRRTVPALPKPDPPSSEKPSPAVVQFVSEGDVRLAISRSEKILIGPRSIVTPSARDLGNAHDIFVETDGV
jgi:hypothetical protein